MTPNNAIFRSLFLVLSGLASVFDYLPDAQTKYPFIFLGSSSNTLTPVLDFYGSARQTIHVYAKRTQRSQLDELVSKIHNEALKLRKGYGYHLDLTGYTENLIVDNSDVQPLLHCVIDLTYTFTKEEE
ncbi:hypothetical protein AB3329_07990 [Streptococcus sp. H31]|uniref:hypothetical protein n=1 Tax=Streptococcus huangxiaojuni TaxID=3237239 RepID=UPI0034A51C86